MRSFSWSCKVLKLDLNITDDFEKCELDLYKSHKKSNRGGTMALRKQVRFKFVHTVAN